MVRGGTLIPFLYLPCFFLLSFLIIIISGIINRNFTELHNYTVEDFGRENHMLKILNSMMNVIIFSPVKTFSSKTYFKLISIEETKSKLRYARIIYKKWRVQRYDK